MSCYVISTPDGHLYACSDGCASDVFEVLATSKPGIVAMHWSPADRDVFCASCTQPIGWRRRSARLLHQAMTPAARAAYQAMEEASCSDR
jgi:hypothetical protein